MKNKIILLAIFCGILSVGNAFGQSSNYGRVCGNPQLKCRNPVVSGDTILSFEGKPGRAIIYESKQFYGIVVQSAKLSIPDCEKVFNEERRLSLQTLFPKNKVFTYTCDETDIAYYSGVAEGIGFIAIYGGETLAQAQKFLNTMRRNGEYKDAMIRKMRVQVNGT